MNRENRTVKLFGHPIHQMLIVFPLGLLATSLVCDIIYLISNNGRWADTAYLMIGLGILGGLAAAVFGFLDWLGIPDGTRAKAVGLWHGAGNVVVTLLFIVSWFLRRPDPQDPGGGAITLSFIGIGLALVTGWLGGELVDRLGIGVDPGAHANSPSSLSDRPASENAGAESVIRPATILGGRSGSSESAAGRQAGMGQRPGLSPEEEHRLRHPAPEETRHNEPPM